MLDFIVLPISILLLFFFERFFSGLQFVSIYIVLGFILFSRISLPRYIIIFLIVGIAIDAVTLSLVGRYSFALIVALLTKSAFDKIFSSQEILLGVMGIFISFVVFHLVNYLLQNFGLVNIVTPVFFRILLSFLKIAVFEVIVYFIIEYLLNLWVGSRYKGFKLKK